MLAAMGPLMGSTMGGGSPLGAMGGLGGASSSAQSGAVYGGPFDQGGVKFGSMATGINPAWIFGLVGVIAVLIFVFMMWG